MAEAKTGKKSLYYSKSKLVTEKGVFLSVETKVSSDWVAGVHKFKKRSGKGHNKKLAK